MHGRDAADDGLVVSRTRSISLLVKSCAAISRWALLTVLSAAALVAALSLLTAAAGARVVKVPTGVGSEEVAVGLQPRDVATFFSGSEKEGNGERVLGELRNSSGAPILPSTNTYAIYWDPTNSYHGNWQHIINVFLQGLGAGSGSLGSVFAVDSQYTDRANQHATYRSVFHGAYTDTNRYPSTGNCTDPSPLHAGRAITCLTDKQMREQLETFITQHDLPRGMGTVYYLLTPPGVAVCLNAGGATGHCSDYPATPEEIEADELARTEPTSYKIYKKSFCSYHSDINPDNATNGDANTVLYAVIPWIAGGLGDFHLAPEDETAAYDCQDGGFYFNPETSIVEKEQSKVNAKEEEEKREDEEAKKRAAAEEEEAKAKTTYEESETKGLITKAEQELKEEELKERRERREENEKETREKAELKEKVAREKKEKLEGPHQQEPNQDGRGEDGSYDTGLADLIVSQMGVEQQNIVTDPLLNGWQDSNGNESTDQCRNFFAPYLGGSVSSQEFTFAGSLFNQSIGGANSYVNDAFSLAATKVDYPSVRCIGGVNLTPEFTVPNPVNTGEIVGFDGMESDITLDAGVKFSSKGQEEVTYPTFTWNFGDGSPEVSGYAPGAPSVNSPGAEPCEAPWLNPCAASIFHTYKYGGTYNVTLTIKDVGGNVASITKAITVDGPFPPSPEPTPSPSPSPAASGGSGPSSGATSSVTSSPRSTSKGTTTKPILPAPVAAQSVMSTSLSKATRKGLVVRYSVNEQVAGTFNVLLNAQIAKRIGLHLPLAQGLPAGTPPQEIVGKAVLITTKGGRGTMKIEFGKVTGARLRRLGKVSLMLQLNLRNASGGTSTVLSQITLR
jgi:hypothetical protein